VIDGTVQANGIELHKRDAVGIWDASAISIHTKEESEYIIIEAPINH
jgi:quercetin 2,3-dioxygenase